jgi:hypothetical protein
MPLVPRGPLARTSPAQPQLEGSLSSFVCLSS